MSETGGEPVLDARELAVQMLQKQGIIEPQDSDETLGDQQELQSDDIETEEQQQVQPRGGHPAWNQILEAVPEEYHESLIPKLKEWDGGVTKRFQEIHSQYEPYKAFEPLVEQGFDVDTISRAIGLFQALSADPEQVYKALGESYGFSNGSEQESEFDEEDYRVPPVVLQQLQRQEQAIEQLTSVIQQQQTQEEEAVLVQELNNYLSDLQQAYGDFDEDYVIALMAQGVDGEVAVRQFQEKINSYTTQRPSAKAPRVMSSSGGGGAPQPLPDPSQLSSQDTRSLVVEALRLAQAEG